MSKRILVEASGSPVSAYMIKAIQDAGHTAIASDISPDCAASVFADEFVLFPRKDDPCLWEKVEQSLVDNRIDLVVPSFDEMLLGWSQRRETLASKGVRVLISAVSTVEVFQDKWLTAQFFEKHHLPCAKSSLEPDYPLVKPRHGRGSMGVYIEHSAERRAKQFGEGDISQSILTGEEYTVDCLFSHDGQPVYIVPRKRLGVVNGKSMGGVVEYNENIDRLITQLAKATHFVGPVNVQCFVEGSKVSLVEVNPRIAGGMALGFAATENWVPLFIRIINEELLSSVPIQWGMKMYRTYQEFFTI
ncbi:ATP-grasp domain-containing protein [Photobacterium sp. BZF1]|uniref:ATP-grasp domain-containing protein n=1 Tax=Photobacterium sp. BZF1 TaxID=1904457 RepID=UPI0016538A13|nr:ATP-grasp domain-containing protein [Photobacterium sp. BZF1]MBC7002013.1 ATP-grasp domain-containing protein [Photobacterium sp. BZF1]